MWTLLDTGKAVETFYSWEELIEGAVSYLPEKLAPDYVTLSNYFLNDTPYVYSPGRTIYFYPVGIQFRH